MVRQTDNIDAGISVEIAFENSWLPDDSVHLPFEVSGVVHGL